MTCLIAGCVIGANTSRMNITFLRNWIPVRFIGLIYFICLAIAVVYAFIWQHRKTDHPATIAFWQGLICYGVAFDLAMFGWEKICHLQLVVPLSKLDVPYRNFSSSELFWNFFSHSYLFGCIIAGIQITGAALLLFSRTRLAGVFVLLPVLTNILLMDIFYQIGGSVVVHASIIMAGLLYFLFIEFKRLKVFFFSATAQLSTLRLPGYIKTGIRLSIIYIPLLLIALHGKADQHPQLTGKYEVKQLRVAQQVLSRNSCADSILTMVYFDVRNSCVFEFNSWQNRWNGSYTKQNDHLQINWRTPTGKPGFSGTISAASSPGGLLLDGMLGKYPVHITLQRTGN